LYGLSWGSSVYAKVVAFNTYGYSNESPLSSPTVLMTNPDEPINLIENTNLRSFTQIAMVWDDGLSGNGSPVYAYVVSVAIGLDSTSFTVLDDNVITKNYIA